MKFQARYGFYLQYGFLTVLYAAVLVSLPHSWRENTDDILIFSDPAAMGLFFMGAVILLEKSQRVTSLFAVSPLKAWTYVGSKVLSLSTIGLLVAAVLGTTARCSHLPMVLLGTLLSSVLFTLLGLIIASKITSLNQFLLATVPVEILAFLPAALHLFGVTPDFLRLYPANVCMDLIAGRACSTIGLIFTISVRNSTGGGNVYYISRILLPALAAFAVTAILLPVFHLTPLSAGATFLLSLSGTLQSIIIGLLIVTISSNKLEGMAVTKLSSLMMLGAVIPHFVPAPFSFGFSFLPSFWMGKGVLERSLLYLLPSIAAAGVWIAALWLRACRACR